ncbi:MAG TPA: VCBS repeat-containing protein, partial [Candidatus Poseidoniaceae archaeon]|nr:VCBS repeat-containing protein [Candidatus Poseidoniaceae archaeon]
MMTSGSPVSSSVKSKQKALVLISLMILSQLVVLIPSVAADIPTNSTLRTTFSDGNDLVTIQFADLGFVNSPGASLEIPQNTTVGELSFDLRYDGSTESPGQLWMDFTQDGTVEYAYNGTGYGQLGNQTQFADDSTMKYYSFSEGTHNGPEIMLPQNSSSFNSLLAIDYTPDNNGRWMNESSIIDMKTLNFDNDSSDEVVILSSEWDTGNGDLWPAIGWINNNSNNDGFTNISWHQTCNDVEHLEIADFDGDGHDDILVWTP